MADGAAGVRPARSRSAALSAAPRAGRAASGAASGAHGIDQSCLDHLVGYQLARADIASRRTFTQHIGAPFGLRPVEFTLLVLVAFNAGITQKQLSQALALPAPNMTLLLDRLAERGLIERVRSQTDRRAQNLQLTRAGRELAARAHVVSLTMEDALLQPLSAGERLMLLELLRKLAGGAPGLNGSEATA